MINLNKKKITGRKASENNKAGLLGLILFFLMTGCTQKRVIYTPQGYDITKFEKMELGNKLHEISGISWVNYDIMLAENDEAGKIFTINLRNKDDKDYHPVVFGEKGDYEDIVGIDSTAYLLISPGQIVEVPGYARGGDVPGHIVATVGGKNNEFETMYYDKDANSLILLCKSCHKEKDEIRTAFRFDLATKTLIDSPYYEISIAAIRQKLNDSRAEFRPSAAAINPIQNNLYIVSSIGKLLVITDKKGKVLQAMPISPGLFNQPEGITFAPNGDMYISNEAGDEQNGTLLKFTYKP